MASVTWNSTPSHWNASPRFGEATELREDEARERLVVLFLGDLELELFVDVAHVRARVDLVAAVRQPADGLRGFLAELLGHLAHELGDDVADRDESGGPPVFVEDDRELLLVAPEVRQERGDELRLGDEGHGAEELPQVGLGELVPRDQLEHLLGVGDTDHRVEALLVDGDPAVPALRDGPHDGFHSLVHLDGRELRARRHDLGHVHVVELDDVFDDLALALAQVVLPLGVLDDVAQPFHDAPCGSRRRGDPEEPHDGALQRLESVDQGGQGALEQVEGGEDRAQQRVRRIAPKRAGQDLPREDEQGDGEPQGREQGGRGRVLGDDGEREEDEEDLAGDREDARARRQCLGPVEQGQEGPSLFVGLGPVEDARGHRVEEPRAEDREEPGEGQGEQREEPDFEVGQRREVGPREGGSLPGP